MVTRLEAQEAAFAYAGGVRAVQGVSLAAHAGELLLVIGPNGAGKSTLLKLFAGLVAPDAGRVALDGRPVARIAPRERARRIAVVPQFLHALPQTSVASFVGGGRYAHLDRWRRSSSADRAAVRSALADADVTDLAERALEELSGGQRQRVLIARALAQEAELLLVDEPTSSLDPEHQVQAFALLARLCAEGRTVLVVTHELNLASQFASRIALLADGCVVAHGGVEDVLRRDVLEPVYGRHLAYGRLPGPGGAGERPFVVPWLQPAEEESG